MKTKKQWIAVLVAMFVTFGVLNAQQKYAVLITGDNNAMNVPVADQWNQGNGMGQYGFDEFWNDTYLFWEMLYTEKGYSDENIFVLYDDGNDLTFDGQWQRYQAFPNYQIQNITDQSATKAHIQTLFTSTLASLVTQDDFLYVWIMSHGGNTNSENDGDAYFYASDGQKVYDYDLADWIGNINANRIAIHFDVPKSGGFINDLQGANRYIYTNCNTYQSAYRADNLAPNGSPIAENENVNGIVYHHGEFNFHIYSSLNGETPVGSENYNNEPLDNADTNDDGIISFGESESWNNIQETTPETAESSDYSVIKEHASPEYPTLIFTSINDDYTYRGLVGVTKFTNVNNSDIVFSANTIVDFLSHTKLYVNAGSNLEIEDDAICMGIFTDSYIYIYNGEVQVGNNVTFSGKNDEQWGGLGVLQAHPLNISNATFNNTSLIFSVEDVSLNNCTFINGAIRKYTNNFTLNNCTLTSTYVDLYYYTQSGLITIDNCLMDNSSGYIAPDNYIDAVHLFGFSEFEITNNEIYDFPGNGLDLVFCGHSGYGTRLIKDNTINGNGWNSWGVASGIYLINTLADIKFNNIISENYCGIILIDDNIGYASLTGNRGTHYEDETQRIIDNSTYEIFVSGDIFPTPFKNNSIHHDLNNYEFVYYDGPNQDLDVRINYWGEEFDPENLDQYFYPANLYVWSPVWNIEPSSSNSNDDEALFETAKEEINQEDYISAQSDFMQLISVYPSSDYVIPSMKELLALESLVSNDYVSLKNYYETNTTITSDLFLQQIGLKLANWCNVKLENFQSAIEFYENIIENPASFQDSINAIIDLNYIYSLMNSASYKSSYIGRLNQYKMNSIEESDSSIIYHSSLLFKNPELDKNITNELKQIKSGELLQNVPNPFKGSTQIWYKLENESTVQLNIFNYTGQFVRTINEGIKTKGNHYIDFDSNGLKNGIYFYSININGRTSDSKKMTIMK